MTLAEIKQRLRAGPYAWPGGYPVYFITSQGDTLSFEAVRENWRDVVAAHICERYRRHGNGWDVAACEINWEDPDLYCEHTGKRIKSAYAD
jgi:hypothetical protein